MMTATQNFITDLLDGMFVTGANKLCLQVEDKAFYEISNRKVDIRDTGHFSLDEILADMEAIGIQLKKTEKFDYLYYSDSIKTGKEWLSVLVSFHQDEPTIVFGRKR
jgi:hypothetical protein